MEIVVRIVGVYLFVVMLEVLKELLFVMVCEVRGVDVSVEGGGVMSVCISWVWKVLNLGA